MSRQLVINSTVCYVLAFLFTTVLHEGGHALVGRALGSNPVLHHNYVAHLNRADLPVAYQAWIALAGPLVSLVQGLLLWSVLRGKGGGGLGRLFLLWAIMLGFGNFLGYLMTGPLFTAGDIGKVEVLLGLSMAIRIALAVIGAAGLTVIAYWSTRPFLEFAPDPAFLSDGRARTTFNFRIIVLPWLMGAAIITLLYLPVVAIVSIIYPISSGMVFIFPWKNARRVGDAQARGAASLLTGGWPWYAVLFVAVGIFRLVLAPGIAL